MADLDSLQDFAAANFTGLTAPLSAAQARAVAEHWLPEIRFYEAEHFYPVSLAELVDQVEQVFGNLPEAARASFRIQLATRSGDTSVFETFDPPVLFEDDSFFASQPGGTQTLVLASRVLGQRPLGNALEGPDVDEDTRLSHGARFDASEEFFGPQRTVSGAAVAVAGDPFEPRLLPITVIATFVNLLEGLRYELLTQEADDYPPDGMRGGFDIIRQLLGPGGGAFGSRSVLLRLVEAQIAGDQLAFQDALDDLPPGISLDEKAWDALTRFAFVEYTFLYPFNDFDRYQTTPFENEHEGDDEGCCLVFERNALNAADASGSNAILLDVTPHSIITSVHEEFQDGDCHQFVAPGGTQEELNLTVWVAAGSHATYLSPGQHDLLDFGDFYEMATDALGDLPVIAQVLGLAFAFLASLLDLFVDTEDTTSDDGIHSGNGAAPNEDVFVPAVIQMLDASASRHIYEPAERDLLALRGFAGKWGGHDGVIDKSPPYKAKTGRYFRRLLEALD